jgi:2-haloacid dehalogenase
MLAAAHEGDLAAARKAGLATAFIARPREYGPGMARAQAGVTGAGVTGARVTGADWDLAGASITEIADRP